MLLFVVIVLATSTSYVVEPGTRGIKVTLGKAERIVSCPKASA